MFKKVVVPLDGSPTAEKILPWVEDYAIRTSSQLHLLRVIPKSEEYKGGKAQIRQSREAYRYLESVAAGIRKEGVKVGLHMKKGSIANGIVEKVRYLGASLFAMTARADNRFDRMLLGGTAEKLLHLIHKPILLINEYAKRSKRQRAVTDEILVPLDGSRLSESVLPNVVHLAELYDARVALLLVGGGKAGDRLDKLGALFNARGLRATTLSRKGDPATQIMKVANQRGVDLIAMNSHGRSGFQKLMLGSVTEEVVHGTEVPILVTRHNRPIKVTKKKTASARR